MNIGFPPTYFKTAFLSEALKNPKNNDELSFRPKSCAGAVVLLTALLSGCSREQPNNGPIIFPFIPTPPHSPAIPPGQVPASPSGDVSQIRWTPNFHAVGYQIYYDIPPIRPEGDLYQFGNWARAQLGLASGEDARIFVTITVDQITGLQRARIENRSPDSNLVEVTVTRRIRGMTTYLPVRVLSAAAVYFLVSLMPRVHITDVQSDGNAYFDLIGPPSR